MSSVSHGSRQKTIKFKLSRILNFHQRRFDLSYHSNMYLQHTRVGSKEHQLDFTRSKL